MKKKLLFKNSFLLSFSQVVSRVIGFLYYIFLARNLSLENFGIYTFTLAFVYNFFPVADFGLERLVLKEISRDHSKAQHYFSRLLPLRLILSFISLFLIAVLALILGQNQYQILCFLLFGLAIIPYNLTFLIASIQNAKEKMQYTASANFLSIIFTVFLGVFFIKVGADLGWVIISFLLSYLIVFCVFVSLLKKADLFFKPVWDKEFMFACLSRSWPFAFFLIIGVFYLRLSVVMVGLIEGPEASGIYGSSYKFIEALILVPQSIALALFPIISRLFLDDKLRLKRIYLKSLAFLLVLSFPIFLVFRFLPELIINFSYGERYLGAVVVYPVFSLAIILFFLNSLPGNIIQSSEKPQKFLPFSIANVLLTLILCLILIPRYSIVGAAWSVFGGELFGLIVNNLYVRKLLRN